MTVKSANVTARVQPEIKQQAEAILAEIGLPVSVLINTLYRQIIMNGGIPYSLSVPKIQTRDSMTDEEFNAVMETGYRQAKNGQTIPLDEAFAQIRKDLKM
jgi:DNA-damage-inducible protein J